MNKESSSGEDSSTKRSWFSPEGFVAFLCCVFLWINVDRGVFSCANINGSRRTTILPSGAGIQGEFNLTGFQDGLLSSSYMIGVLITAPIFSETIHYVNAMRSLGLGVGAWILAIIGTALSHNYILLAICRAFVGVGEAAIVSLAPSFIDDNAPTKRKGVWLACLYTCSPFGIGLGYILGGIAGAAWNWRVAFFIEAGVMAPFFLLLMIAPAVDIKKDEAALSLEKDMSPLQSFFNHMWIIFSHPVYVFSAIGYTIYMFLMGIVVSWAPKAVKSMFGIEGADAYLGMSSAVTGVVGTIAGGILLDKFDCSISQALNLSGVPTLAAGLILIPNFLFAPSFAVFIGPFIIGAVLIFILQAPINGVFLWSVPTNQRTLATSISNMLLHILGDLPSPAIFGALLDWLTDVKNSEPAGYRAAIGAAGSLLIVSSIVFFLVARASKNSTDYRESQKNSSNTPADGDDQDSEVMQQPLLQP